MRPMIWLFALVIFLKSIAVAEAQESSSPVNVTGNDNVVSVGQIGGITARTVTVIEQALRPEFRILAREDKDLPDGSHQVSLRGDVVSPITPGLLALQIQAADLKNVQIMPPPVGGVSSMTMRNVRRGSNFYSTEIPSPRGEYNIVITTGMPTEIGLAASF
jgi:hypothetical protein